MTPTQRAKAALDNMPTVNDKTVIGPDIVEQLGEWALCGYHDIREALEQMADEGKDANIGRHVRNGWIVHPNGSMYDAVNHAVVPREPTLEMRDAGAESVPRPCNWFDIHHAEDVYKAMIAAQESSSEGGGSLMLSCCGVCEPTYKRTEPMPAHVCERMAKELESTKRLRSEFYYCEDVK
jgi:hypothetical protein